MILRSVPSGRGATWVRQAFAAFAARPIAFTALFATFLFAVFASALLPFVGSLIVLALLPLVSLGFMIATRSAIAGGFPTPRVFIEPLRTDRPRRIALLQLGVLYAGATLAILWLSDLADGGAFDALMQALPSGQTAPDAVAARLATPGLLTGMVLRFGLSGLLSIPFWHAPALVHWEGHGCAKALFSSTLACWRNRGAFTVYGLAWFALIMLLGMAGSLLFALLGQPAMFAVAAVPMSLLLTTVFYVSLYFTFADCFIDESGAPRTVVST
jgi:hypothetical protein